MHRPSSYNVIGRLAPSPTGAQHVGNARTYLLAWLSARLQGGQLLLRMEDIDSPRIKAGAQQQAIEDLQWLGLDWDFGPGGTHSTTAVELLPADLLELQAVEQIGGVQDWLQTRRTDVYQHYFSKLKLDQKVYPCICSRKDIQMAASAPNLGDDATIYPGSCAGKTVADGDRMSLRFENNSGGGTHDFEATDQTQIAPKFAWRYRTCNRTMRFVDQIMGPQTCRPQKELGDFVVGRSYGEFAYQLAVVIDDHLMGVTEVVRGDDLVASTFRQLELYETFGWQTPTFAHVPLVVGEDGRRLAKRHGDTRLSEIRRRGLGPEKLLGLLAHSCHLQEDVTAISATQLLESLRSRVSAQCSPTRVLWNRLPRTPFVLTDRMWQAILD